MEDKQNAVLELLDVFEIKYENNTQVADKSRTFCAISLRKRANTTIKSNDKTFLLSDRSLTFFPSNTPYYRQSVYDDMIVIHFNSSIALSDSICTVSDFDYDTVLKKFENALLIWNSLDNNKYYRASAILYEIVAFLYKNINHNQYSKQMQSAINYIKQNLHNPDFSVKDISKELNICPTALRNLFKREMGCSPKEFAVKYKMSEAVSMLNSHFFSITQVAESLGFSDQKNFSTAFKKYYGYPPSKQKYNFRNND